MFSRAKKSFNFPKIEKISMGKKKGYIYIVEVLLAIGIMLAAVFFVFGTSADIPDYSHVIMGQTGFDALHYLDNKGILRQLVHERKETELENALSPLIPDNIGYETEICTVSCSNANLTGTQTVISIDYYISSYRESYVGKKVRLWLWSRS